MNRTIPNYAMIAARDFAHRDLGLPETDYAGGSDGINDGVWCQSALNVSDIGSWKLPNGNAVSDDPEFNPIHMANRPGQVGLLRSEGIGSSPYQGIYTCTIPDENGVNQTLAVWAAGNAAYDGGTDSNRELNEFFAYYTHNGSDGLLNSIKYFNQYSGFSIIRTPIIRIWTFGRRLTSPFFQSKREKYVTVTGVLMQEKEKLLYERLS